jgi:putative addiction module component (TIGR02574 family)
MSTNFRELEAKMSPESRARSDAKAKKMLAEMALDDRLVESLDDEPAEEGVEETWAEEIKRRVDEVRSGRIETVPGERLRERLNARRRDAHS